MAKISKKPPRTSPIEIDQINQFIFESGLDDDAGFIRPEPITHIPNVDIFTTPADLVIEVELPGVRKEDIDITLCKDTLTIKALKFECFEEDRINYVCMERSFGRLFRTIELPFPVDTAKIKANYDNGILIVTIPRVEDKRNMTKKIPIHST